MSKSLSAQVADIEVENKKLKDQLAAAIGREFIARQSAEGMAKELDRLQRDRYARAIPLSRLTDAVSLNATHEHGSSIIRVSLPHLQVNSIIPDDDLREMYRDGRSVLRKVLAENIKQLVTRRVDDFAEQVFLHGWRAR